MNIFHTFLYNLVMDKHPYHSQQYVQSRVSGTDSTNLARGDMQTHLLDATNGKVWSSWRKDVHADGLAAGIDEAHDDCLGLIELEASKMND